MKVSKQKIENIKNKIKSIREKVTNSHKEKVPKKYYALLVIMMMLGIMTISNNIKEYNKSKQQEYKEYKLEEKPADSSNIQIVKYQTAQSSISTDVSTIIEEEAVETISRNSELNYIMPVIGEVIKEFAQEKLVYSDTLGMWKTHPGIDIKAELNSQVKSVSDGKVIVIQQDSFYGNTVKILDGQGYTFVYSNLDNAIKLKQGDNVKQGDVIGTVGVSAAGELADETHLHFEVIKDEIQVDPQDLIN